MSAAEIIDWVRTLPRDEQLRIAEQILNDLADDSLAEAPEMLAELEWRAEEFRRNPNNGLPWEQVRDEIRQRFGWK
jgi:putative addiction module component (TIGR02574 family)